MLRDWFHLAVGVLVVICAIGLPLLLVIQLIADAIGVQLTLW